MNFTETFGGTILTVKTFCMFSRLHTHKCYRWTDERTKSSDNISVLHSVTW